MATEAVVTPAPMEKPTLEGCNGNYEQYVEKLTDYKTDEQVKEARQENKVQKRIDKLVGDKYELRQQLDKVLAANHVQQQHIGELMAANQLLLTSANQLLAALTGMREAQQVHLALIQDNQKLKADLQKAVHLWKTAKGEKVNG